MSQYVPCSLCDGVGTLALSPSQPKHECPVCLGSGRKRVWITSPEWQPGPVSRTVARGVDQINEGVWGTIYTVTKHTPGGAHVVLWVIFPAVGFLVGYLVWAFTN